MSVAAIAAAVVSVSACVTDLRWRRIPNLLTFAGAAAALVFYSATQGLSGLGFSAAGFAIGLVIFLPLFVVRGLGGGDVKLMAALGAWIGPASALWLAALAAIAGGVFALIVAAANRYTGQAFRNVGSILTFWRVMGVQAHPTLTLESSRGPRLPYSLPIAAGLGLTLWLA